MRENIKTQKGITLVALLITIVILLIIAAVAINSIQGEGMIVKTESGASRYNQSVKNEYSIFQDYEDLLTSADGTYDNKTYEKGDIVKVGTEEFYVLEDKTTEGKVVLITKQCVVTDESDSNYLTQSDQADTVVFSTEVYWEEETSTNYIIEEDTLPIPASHKAAKAAYDYGEKLGGKGRLLTYSEAEALDTEILYGVSDEIVLSYWLGSAKYSEDGVQVYYVQPPKNIFSISPTGSQLSVRPVVEISKSKLS